MKVINIKEIKKSLDVEKAVSLQKEGFKLYSKGKVTVPPVGYMNFGQRIGEVHLKYGWIEGDDIFVVKIAGAFYQNPEEHGLASVQGIILVFDAKTGRTRAILQDEGYLTNMRTAITGLIAAKYLAPKEVTGIGILGTGVQARLQAELLKQHTNCRNLWVWGRDQDKVAKYIHDMTAAGFQTSSAQSTSELCKHCNLIVTTTSAERPLIYAKDVQPGTHITAVGADAPGKQELDPEIFRLADICVVDSKSQCLDHGETYHPHQAGILTEKNLVELGDVISDLRLQRQSGEQVTIADLTGISVQDIQIAKSVLFSPRISEGE